MIATHHPILALCLILFFSCQSPTPKDQNMALNSADIGHSDMLIAEIETEGDSFCIDVNDPSTVALHQGPTHQSSRYMDVGIHEGSSHEEPYIKLGTGRGEYEEISNGDTLSVVKGIQGGYHVWGAFVGKCIPFQNVEITFLLKDGDRLLAQANYTESQLYLNDQNEIEYSAVTVIYLNNDDVQPNTGKTLDFSVRINEIGKTDIFFEDHKQIITSCCQ